MKLYRLETNISPLAPQEKYRILPGPLHSQALQYSLSNLNRELAGHTTDNPEFIDGELHIPPLLYCLYIAPHENQPTDFNIHHLRGWRYGEMIIVLATKNRCHLYEAWRPLMQTRFDAQEAEDRRVVDLTEDYEVIDLTTHHEVIDLTGED
jgi:hypothetical protein